MAKELVPNLALCNSHEQLALALGVSYEELIALAGAEAVSLYRQHRIPKRSAHRRGEFRIVYEPLTEQLKYLHKSIGRRLALFVTMADPSFPHDSSYGYRRRKSIIDNALPHCGAKLLFKTDIENFFPSVTQQRVKGLLLKQGVRETNADLLSRVYCVAGHLTLGLSGSPLLANLACHDLDKRLADLCGQQETKYSRYADDLSFSGDKLPGVAEIESLVEAEGFKLSATKSRTIKRGQAQFVTGLSIGDPERPHVPRDMKHKLRQELFYCKKFGIDEHLVRVRERPRAGLMRLDGLVRYVSFIEKDSNDSYSSVWESLLARDDKTVRPSPNTSREPITRTVAIDETIIDLGDTKVLAIGAAVFQDRKCIEASVAGTVASYLANPFSPGRRSDVEKEGLHFQGAHPALRAQFIAQLPLLPFRCVLGYKRMAPGASYEATYFDVLRWLVGQLLSRGDGERLHALVERNSQITSAKVQETFNGCYEIAKTLGVKRPIDLPKVDLVEKPSNDVPVCDFMIGVFREYVEKTHKDGASAFMDFERIRDRFAFIYDLDAGVAYSRKNPFSKGNLKGP
jgi:RNA-directed DNA polymerase